MQGIWWLSRRNCTEIEASDTAERRLMASDISATRDTMAGVMLNGGW